MKLNIWFVMFLATMPLFILIVGLSAAADVLDHGVTWVLSAVVLGAGLGCAYMAARPSKQHALKSGA